MSDRRTIENIQGVYISLDPTPTINGQEVIDYKGLQYYSIVKTKTRVSYIKEKCLPKLQDKVAGLANQIGADCAVIGDSYVDGKGELWHKIDFHALSVDPNKDEDYISKKTDQFHKAIIKQESLRQYHFLTDMFSLIFLFLTIILMYAALFEFDGGFLSSICGLFPGDGITEFHFIVSLFTISFAIFLYRCYRSEYLLIPRIHLSSL